jgi:uroporphyrin-3 C-methyltransferase
VSEHQDKNIEQVAEEIAASSEVTKTMNTADSEVARAPAPAPARSSAAVAWLAILMVLAVAGGLAWFVWEQQRVAAGVSQRLQQLEAAAVSKVPAIDDAELDARLSEGLDQLNTRWQGQLEAGLADLKNGMGDLGSESSQLGQTLQALQSQLAQQRVELARIGATDREAWVVAEAEYLLRLANQRLTMARDAVAAEALLSNVDKILLELGDPGLHEVRAAVAADLAAVRAVPTVDVEGIYLRLSALVEQAGQLKIFQVQAEDQQLEPAPASAPAPAPAEGWQGRLQTGYEAALAKLSDYLIIRRRDVPMQAMMDPQWEGLVRQNLRMLLEQAQVALLSGNQTLYRESLRRAQHWVDEFFESDGAAARAMSAEIGQLADLDIAASVPAISRSIQALDDAMQQRLQQGGEE